MTIYKADITGKIRKAIDDIMPSASDSFTANTDAELWQATQHAVEQLLLELPLEMMDHSSMLPLASGAHTQNADGSGYVKVADGFLRFVSMKLSTWLSPVYVLIEPGSDEEMRQRTRWGRGTPEKPRVMLDSDASGNTVLRYWTAGKSGTPPQYVHTVEQLNYIPMPTVTDAVIDQTTHQVTTDAHITCALKSVAEKAVIYRAASIFFEGKKEPETADKFRNI